MPVAQAAERREPESEGRLEPGRVLAGDGVAPCGQAHAFDERPGGRRAHVLLGDAAEPAGPREADGAVSVARIAHVEILKDAPQPIPERAAGREGGARQRRQEKDDAQVGVGADMPPRGADRLEDETSHPAPDAAREGRADGAGAEHEIPVSEPRKIAPAADVSRLRRQHFHEAGGLCGRRDHAGASAGRRAHRTGRPAAVRAAIRFSTTDATSDARSTDVVRCKAFQPGMPFTSTTSLPPVSRSRTSTPA